MTDTDRTDTDRAPVTPAAVRDTVRYLDTWLAFRHRLDRVPGVQAAVLHGDTVVLSTAHGVADVASATPLTARHLFRIASHSKTFTATAVMQLVQGGTVRLDDPVGRWLTFLDEAGSPLARVTLRELLAHGGGVVRDGHDGDHWQLADAFPDRERLRRIALDDAAVLPRNERFKYSNIGYSLLGMVLEEVTGRPFADVVRDAVIEPLGLTDTGPELDPRRAGDYATGYTALAYATGGDGGRRLPIEHVDTAAMASATGFYSTARDVVRYVAAHFPGDERLLDDDTKRVMQRTEWAVDGGADAYALGFAVQPVGARRLLGHGGGYPGHITRTLFDPQDRLAVSVLTNTIDGPALTYASAAFRLLDLATSTGGTGRGGVGGAEGSTARADLARFRGRFANLWGVYDVVDLGGRLYQVDPTQDDPAQEATLLEVVDDQTLRVARTRGYGSYGETLSYDRAEDGTVRSVRGNSAQTSYPLDALQEAVTHRERITPGSPLAP